MSLSKVLNIVLGVLLAVSAVLLISMMVNISDNPADPAMSSWINTNLTWSYILLIFGAAAALVFGFIQMVTDKRAAKSGLTAIVFMGVVVGLAYVLSPADLPVFHGVEKFIADGTLTEAVSKWIGAGLLTTYILFGIAIISMLIAPVMRLFR